MNFNTPFRCYLLSLLFAFVAICLDDMIKIKKKLKKNKKNKKKG